MTYLLEDLGALAGEEVVPTLLAHLTHESPLVREGAAYGLAHHITAPGVRSAFASAIIAERHPALRRVFSDILDGWTDNCDR